MENAQLSAERRYVLGKGVRFLRREGLLPANLYGHGLESMALQLPKKEMERFLAEAEGAALVNLALAGGESRMVLVKSVQRDPIKDEVLHIDFQQVAMTEKVRLRIALHFTGEAPAVKAFDGTLLRSLEAVEVQALPGDLPGHVEVDLSALRTLDDAIHVRDLPLPPGIEVLTDPEELVAKVSPPTVVTEEAQAAVQEAAQTAERAQPETVEEPPQA